MIDLHILQHYFCANEYEGSDESWNDSCYDAGYDDGQNGPFSELTWDHCGDEEGGDDAYYDGFIDGFGFGGLHADIGAKSRFLT